MDTSLPTDRRVVAPSRLDLARGRRVVLVLNFHPRPLGPRRRRPRGRRPLRLTVRRVRAVVLSKGQHGQVRSGRGTLARLLRLK